MKLDDINPLYEEFEPQQNTVHLLESQNAAGNWKQVTAEELLAFLGRCVDGTA
jgi:hypothetical protein